MPSIASVSRAPGEARSPRRSVLVIDEDPGISSAVAAILRKAGYDVTTAQSGTAGLAALLTGGFAVVITALFMPEHDGLEILRAARQQAPAIKTVVMSSKSQQRGMDYLRIASRLGADAVLARPFDSGELVATVTRLLDDPAPVHASSASPSR